MSFQLTLDPSFSWFLIVFRLLNHKKPLVPGVRGLVPFGAAGAEGHRKGLWRRGAGDVFPGFANFG